MDQVRIKYELSTDPVTTNNQSFTTRSRHLTHSSLRSTLANDGGFLVVQELSDRLSFRRRHSRHFLASIGNQPV